MKMINYFVLVFLILLPMSSIVAKTVDLKKVEKEVSALLEEDWLDIVRNGETLNFCPSYIIKTNNQLVLLQKKGATNSKHITFLANEKITCLNSSKEASLLKLAKRAKQIMHRYGLSTSIERKWLEMRPYYIDREIYNAVANDKLTLYFRLLAYGAYYGNTAIGHSVVNLALESQSNKIIEYFLKKEKVDLNWTTNGGSAPLSILINHKKIRYDLLEYALKVLKTDPNYNGEHANFPISVALKNNDEKSMALLIKYGAKVNLNTFDYFGCAKEMLLDQAIKKGNKNIIKLLRKAGAKTYKECRKNFLNQKSENLQL